MSRSKKIPILKDRNRNYKKSAVYWRRIRRVWKNKIASAKNTDYEDFFLPSPKAIVDDYDFCDWIWDYAYTLNDPKYEETRKKYSRK